MRNYEMMYIIRPELEEAAVNETMEKIKGVITEHGGEMTNEELIGKRRLAYEIQKIRDGIYVLLHFTAPREVVEQLNYTVRISDQIIRHLIVNDMAS